MIVVLLLACQQKVLFSSSDVAGHSARGWPSLCPPQGFYVKYQLSAAWQPGEARTFYAFSPYAQGMGARSQVRWGACAALL